MPEYRDGVRVDRQGDTVRVTPLVEAPDAGNTVEIPVGTDGGANDPRIPAVQPGNDKLPLTWNQGGNDFTPQMLDRAAIGDDTIEGRMIDDGTLTEEKLSEDVRTKLNETGGGGGISATQARAIVVEQTKVFAHTVTSDDETRTDLATLLNAADQDAEKISYNSLKDPPNIPADPDARLTELEELDEALRGNVRLGTESVPAQRNRWEDIAATPGPGNAMIPAQRPDRHLRVNVTATAVPAFDHEVDIADLLASGTGVDGGMRGVGGLEFPDPNSSRRFFIGHTAGGELLFAADTADTYTVTLYDQEIVVDRFVTGPGIRDKLQGLEGENRLDASAVKNLPAGGGGTTGMETRLIAVSALPAITQDHVDRDEMVNYDGRLYRATDQGARNTFTFTAGVDGEILGFNASGVGTAHGSSVDYGSHDSLQRMDFDIGTTRFAVGAVNDYRVFCLLPKALGAAQNQLAIRVHNKVSGAYAVFELARQQTNDTANYYAYGARGAGVALSDSAHDAGDEIEVSFFSDEALTTVYNVRDDLTWEPVTLPGGTVKNIAPTQEQVYGADKVILKAGDGMTVTPSDDKKEILLIAHPEGIPHGTEFPASPADNDEFRLTVAHTAPHLAALIPETVGFTVGWYDAQPRQGSIDLPTPDIAGVRLYDNDATVNAALRGRVIVIRRAGSDKVPNAVIVDGTNNALEAVPNFQHFYRTAVISDPFTEGTPSSVQVTFADSTKEFPDREFDPDRYTYDASHFKWVAEGYDRKTIVDRVNAGGPDDEKISVRQISGLAPAVGQTVVHTGPAIGIAVADSDNSVENPLRLFDPVFDLDNVSLGDFKVGVTLHMVTPTQTLGFRLAGDTETRRSVTFDDTLFASSLKAAATFVAGGAVEGVRVRAPVAVYNGSTELGDAEIWFAKNANGEAGYLGKYDGGGSASLNFSIGMDLETYWNPTDPAAGAAARVDVEHHPAAAVECAPDTETTIVTATALTAGQAGLYLLIGQVNFDRSTIENGNHGGGVDIVLKKNGTEIDAFRYGVTVGADYGGMDDEIIFPNVLAVGDVVTLHATVQMATSPRNPFGTKNYIHAGTDSLLHMTRIGA